MSVTEILDEIRKSQKVIERENGRIAELTTQLGKANFDDYDWVTVKQGADGVGVSVAMIYRKINDGELEVKNIGAKTFVRASQLKKVNDR